MMELQPIETAPRDGTIILVCGGTLQEAIHGDKTPLKGFALVYYEKSLDEEGWYVAHCNYYHPMILNPTDWMPLPAPREDRPSEKIIREDRDAWPDRHQSSIA